MSYAIEGKNLHYTYSDGTKALNGVSLAAETGKITGILGSNGAGKSTLFLNLNGVCTPEAGEVYLAGEKITYNRKSIARLRQGVGIVFQNPDDQLFSADVYRDISFGPVNLGLPPEEVHRRVEKVMAQLDITSLKDKPTHALSYGQKKRVAIAGVLAMEPEVIILDEPTAGLDPQGVSSIVKVLREIRDCLHITILLSTHDMDMVPLLCDYCYLLSEGKVQSQGTPEELFSQPELLRRHRLRLPRISHLMEILQKKDGIGPGSRICTISQARKELRRLLKTNH